MIEQSTLTAEIIESRRQSVTSDFIRQLTFFVVDRALLNHYPISHSMKCFQSSLAIQLVLKRFKIKSQVILGELCVPQVFDDELLAPNWSGFWGDNHHVWLLTEFGELVDLNVRYLHKHPESQQIHKQLEMPAIWWNEITQWPSILRYFPQGPVEANFSQDEMDDFEQFKKHVSKTLEFVISSMAVEDLLFSPILEGTDSINELRKKGNLWLQRSAKLQNMTTPYPKIISDREQELMGIPLKD
ncbi:MAG: hypothetical protein JKX92_02570 [Porticoccaceae bacterium]|nr:hypothetical protein [Porticoccaceae bacterium]